MKALAVAVMLLSLAGCGLTGTDTAKSPRTLASGKVALPTAPPPPPLPDDAVACPADAKLCADGSYVSRNATQGCAFNPCPDATKQ